MTAALVVGAARSGVAVANHLARHGERVIVPASVIAGWPHVFVKLERHFGFFDEAGWRPVPAWSVAEAAGPDPAREAVEVAQGV